MSGQVQQILFLIACSRKLLEIRLVYDYMAGRAGHHAFTGAFERLARGPGDVEQPLTGLGFDLLVERAVWLVKADFDHAARPR